MNWPGVGTTAIDRSMSGRGDCEKLLHVLVSLLLEFVRNLLPIDSLAVVSILLLAPLHLDSLPPQELD